MVQGLKQCEKCGVEIPLDYVNALCNECYRLLEMGVEASKSPVDASLEQKDTLSASNENPVILDPNYHENEEVEEIDMISRMHGRFKGTGIVMPEAQKTLYTAIKNYCHTELVMKNAQYPKFIWKPKICDVGCGLGVGANILSQEAEYVLGLDKNQENINWAKQVFTREKNNVYWTSQLDFEVSDVMTEEREMMKFDIVTCVEVFEHLKNAYKLIVFLKKLMKPKGVLFISTPNRNSEKIQKDRPRNDHHVRELSSNEFYSYLKSHFNTVELFDFSLNPVDENTTVTPIVAKCSL